MSAALCNIVRCQHPELDHGHHKLLLIRFTVSGLSSVLSHRVNSDMDFGHLTCSATNTEGEMEGGCGVDIVPARPPQPPAGCVVLNQVTLKYPDNNDTSCYASHFVERVVVKIYGQTSNILSLCDL